METKIKETKFKTIKMLNDKIKKIENDLETLREKKDNQILKEMYAIINKRKIPIESVFYMLENYDFSDINQELTDEDETDNKTDEITETDEIKNNEEKVLNSVNTSYKERNAL